MDRQLSLYYYPMHDRYSLKIFAEVRHISQLTLSEFPLEYLDELHINPIKRLRLASDNNIGYAPHLQRLSLCNMEIDDSVYFALSEAMINKNLPNLTDLSLAGSTVTKQLNRLFKPKLKSGGSSTAECI